MGNSVDGAINYYYRSSRRYRLHMDLIILLKGFQKDNEPKKRSNQLLMYRKQMFMQILFSQYLKANVIAAITKAKRKEVSIR